MIALNHALTGALIGLNVGNPAAAVGLASISHFVCDAIPHFGSGKSNDETLSKRWFAIYLLVDAILCGVLVLLLAVSQPYNWLLAAICAFTAAAPDFMWFPDFLKQRQGLDLPQRRSSWTHWATTIQWFEKPSGAIVEFVWFGGAVVLLAAYL